jgi:VWFA-related protein
MRTAVLAVFLAAGTIRAQAPEAVFKATTKLVEMSVIAQDKDGKAVGDLRREEFQIFDNGSPQEIRVFLSEGASVANPAPPAEPGTFTNRVAASPGSGSGGSRRGYSVILFDNLVTGFGDPDDIDGTGFGVNRVLKVLRSLPEGEHVAIYAIRRRRLQIIREFTTDRESLERQLRAWKPSVDDSFIGTALCPGDAKTNSECVRIDSLERIAPFGEELIQIADHLAGIPGRKNMIWMGNQFPITGPALRKLINAGVAVYPVDEKGIKDPVRETFQGAGSPAVIAQLTGGVAYTKRNDLDIVVREAMEDGRVSYTLGFYQPGDDKAPAIHRLGVRVSRAGVTLRYRSSYEAEPRRAAPVDPVADMVQAMNEPVDATAIGITASATRTQDRLDLTAKFDVSKLDLKLDQGLRKGTTEIVARFMAADATQAGDTVAETVTLNLRLATYEAMAESGMPYHKELSIPAKAVELKLLIGNPASGKIGTLTIPLTEIGGK